LDSLKPLEQSLLQSNKDDQGDPELNMQDIDDLGLLEEGQDGVAGFDPEQRVGRDEEMY